jgi:hypothetical protein
MEDREWMYSGRLGQGQVTDEWIDKTDALLERPLIRPESA